MMDLSSNSPFGGTTTLGNAALNYKDFWPENRTPELNLRKSTFETFDVLVGRLNAWLAQNQNVDVKNFQTVEKKLSSMEDLTSGTAKFQPPTCITSSDIYLKGLRVWYGNDFNHSNKISQVGYMNVLPRVVDDTQKKPVFENQEGLYQQANEKLKNNPIPGVIVTIETVSLQFHDYDARNILPDVSNWKDGYSKNVFAFMRIFYMIGDTVPETVGAVDFLPSCIKEKGACSWPAFDTNSSVKQMNQWLQNYLDKRVVNIQCQEAQYNGGSGNIDSRENFFRKYEKGYTVKFLRVYYTKPLEVSAKMSISDDVSVKTFVPACIERKCCGALVFEQLSGLEQYMQEWLRVSGKEVLYAELVYRPTRHLAKRANLQHDLDVMYGHWYVQSNGQYGSSVHPHHMVYIIRVYLKGNYIEPPSDHLPSRPGMTDNCCCTIV